MKIRLIALATLALLVVAPAFADIVHMKAGGQIEGVVESDDGTTVKVRTKVGVMSIPKSKILRIEEKKTSLEVYEERLKALAPDDANGHYLLALYCDEHGMKKQYKALLASTLKIQPQHDGANEAVGNVQHHGSWMTPAEKADALANAADADMRAKGFVRYNGEWVTPEDKAAMEKGLVKYKGKWVTEEEKMTAEGFVRYKDGWVKKSELERIKIVDHYAEVMELDVEAAISDHFAAVGPFTQDQLEEIVEGAEQVYEQFLEIFGIDEENDLLDGFDEDAGRKRCYIVYSKKALDYHKVIDEMVEKYPRDLPPRRAALSKQQKGFYHVSPACYVLGCQFPNTFNQVKASVMHKTSHVLLLRYETPGAFPWWLIEGLGTFQEISALGHCDTYCVTEGGYGVQEGTTKSKWAGLSRWKQIAKSQVVQLQDRSALMLSKAGLNSLDYKDLAKCWSLVEWLIGHNRDGFIKLVKEIKKQTPFPDATKNALGWTPTQLDKKWRDYVRKNY